MTTQATGAGEQRVVLRNINWATFEAIRASDVERVAPRLTYDNGDLEVVSPLIPHEKTLDQLDTIVKILLEEWNIEYEALRSLTLESRARGQSAEPDACFYVGDVERVAGQDRVDPEAGDAPPDLIIEVDITSPSLQKLPLYAALGVPEVWRFRLRTVTILHRDETTYVEADHSLCLPRLTSDALNTLLRESQELSRLNWQRSVRAWARQQDAVADTEAGE